jgi:7,8-dihydropterin-6-yl-methyl-4-(beta-D-ribofuranosyl)aminobenzene 5'-phosphate synthase
MHWDHTGGLWKLLEARPGLSVVIPEGASVQFKNRVRRLGGQYIENPQDPILREDLFSSGTIMGTYNGRPMPEQAIIWRGNKGLVLIAGCAHPGILTMVERVADAFQAPVRGVMGGLHLMEGYTAEAIRRLAGQLQESGVQWIAPTHCTGARAEKIFQKVFGSGYVPLREGKTISLHD